MNRRFRSATWAMGAPLRLALIGAIRLYRLIRLVVEVVMLALPLERRAETA